MNLKKIAFWAQMIVCASGLAQTKINLATQSGNADFSGAPRTRPFKTGTVLPGTCSAGDMFFKTDAPSGGNLYGCVGTNLWAIETGNVVSALDLADFTPSVASGILTIQPGRLRFGTFPCTNFTLPMTASITAGSGAGLAALYVSDSCAVVMEYPNSLALTFSLNNVTAAMVFTPSVPPTAFYIGDVTISGGAITSVVDKRSVLSTFAPMAGSGIVIDCSTGPCLFSIDPATVAQLGATNIFTGVEDARNSIHTFPSKQAASDPALCDVGEQYYNSTTNTRKDCTAPNTWTAVGGTSGPAGPTGPQGPAGATGATGPAGASSGGAYTSTQAMLASATVGNTDQVIFVTGNLPALPASSCYSYLVDIYAPSMQPSVVKIWYGTNPGTTGSSLVLSPDPVGSGYPIEYHGRICNNFGVQNAQTIAGWQDLQNSSGGFSSSGTGNQDGTSASLKIGFTMNNTGGAYGVIPILFKVWSEF